MTDAALRPAWPAPAKINLHLRVTGLAADGRHTLDTSFMFVDCADELTIRPTSGLRVRCTQPELNGPDNLVWRALAAMRRRFDRDARADGAGMDVFIRKRLPARAGLGGGSSDAATAMLAANALWNLNLGVDELIELAAPLGADIPCFLFGRASRARGIGERLAPLDAGLATALDGRPVLLARPAAGLSTARVFAEYDRLAESGAPEGRLTPPEAADTIRADAAGGGEPPEIGSILGRNDLEEAAARLCPPLAALLSRMRELAGAGGAGADETGTGEMEGAWMSGSGTACVALVPSLEAARELARELEREDLAAWTHAGRLLARHPLLADAPGNGTAEAG